MNEYSTTRYSSSIRNVMARLLSLVNKALKERKYLPKAIVIVPDDDILKQIPIKKPSKNALMIILQEFLKVLDTKIIDYKGKLQTKAKHEHYPHIIWIPPPTHRNFSNNKYRSKFSEVLETIIEQSYSNTMCSLKLKKVWDEEVSGIFLQHQRRFTPKGYLQYWRGVDASLKFWDKTLAKILVKKQKKAQFKLHRSATAGKQTVKSTVHKLDDNFEQRRRLPPPPLRK